MAAEAVPSWRRRAQGLLDVPLPVAWARLCPPIDVDGPRVRLGVLWALVTVVAVGAGPVLTALVFAGPALGAAGQACRSWRGKERRPHRPTTIGGAVLIVLAGTLGVVAVAATAVATVVAAVAVARPGAGSRSDPRLTSGIALLVGIGAAAPAVVRDDLGATPALVLVALVHAVDAANFIVGSDARSPSEGWAAGLASAAAVALAVATVFAPPFRGPSPWLLAAAVAALAPAGTLLASAALGRPDAPVPALRRIDSFLLAGPAWGLMATALLDL